MGSTGSWRRSAPSTTLRRRRSTRTSWPSWRRWWMRSSWWSRAREPLLPVRVVLFAALVPLLLRLCKLPDPPSWIDPRRRSLPPPDPSEFATLTERIDEPLIAGRPAVRTGCMVRGLSLYRFLRRAGAEVSLPFGVGTIRGDFAAHYWIVY